MNNRVLILLTACLLAITNCISFFLMGYDKHSAKKHRWRVSEKTLFIACACFGALGGVLGMKIFHHKTQHWYFRVFFPVMLVLQIIILFCVYYFLIR